MSPHPVAGRLLCRTTPSRYSAPMPTSRCLLRIVRASVLLTVVLGACRAPFDPDNGSIIPPVTSGPLIPFRIGWSGPDFARAVVADGSGNAYVTGYFAGTVDFDPASTASGRTASGPSDISVAKYSSTGDLVWVYSIGGTDSDTPFDIKLGSSNGVYVAGTVSAGAVCSGRVVKNSGGHDILLMRLNSAGTCDWALGIGGSGEDQAQSMLIEPNGDVVVTGFFSGTVDFDPGAGSALLVSRGGHDGFVARYGADGTFETVVQFGGAEDDAGNAIARTVEGDLVVGGEFRGVATFGSALAPVLLTSAGDVDFFLTRLSPQLGTQWATRGGGTGADAVGLNSIQVDGLGRIWVAGAFSGVADLDGSPLAVLVTSLGSSDIFVARYDGTGAWAGVARAIGGSGGEAVDKMVIDASGNLYLAGWFQNSVDFDPGAGTHVVVAKGSQGAGDGFVLSLDAGAEFRWVDPIGSVIAGDGNLGITSGLALDSGGSLWAVGRFFGRVTFDLTDPTVQAQSLGDADQYVARYGAVSGVLNR
jgi:hypothetical protein